MAKLNQAGNQNDKGQGTSSGPGAVLDALKKGETVFFDLDIFDAKLFRNFLIPVSVSIDKQTGDGVIECAKFEVYRQTYLPKWKLLNAKSDTGQKLVSNPKTITASELPDDLFWLELTPAEITKIFEPKLASAILSAKAHISGKGKVTFKIKKGAPPKKPLLFAAVRIKGNFSIAVGPEVASSFEEIINDLTEEFPYILEK